MSAIWEKIESLELPSPMKVFNGVLIFYFFITAGIAYDIIHEPPAVGAHPDPVTGKLKPVTFMPYRINGQYIIEGLTGGFLYTLGGLGIILMDRAHQKGLAGKSKLLLFSLGSFSLVAAYLFCMVCLKIKMPSYRAAW